MLAIKKWIGFREWTTIWKPWRNPYREITMELEGVTHLAEDMLPELLELRAELGLEPPGPGDGGAGNPA